MNNVNNIKLSKINCKVLENNQNYKRIVKVDLANENYSGKLNFDFLQKKELLSADLLIAKTIGWYSKQPDKRGGGGGGANKKPPTERKQTEAKPTLLSPIFLPKPAGGQSCSSRHLS